jgi:hypothetical protein
MTRSLAVRAATAALLTAAFACAASPAAQAFDTASHNDITVDALTAEGFGKRATDVARVSNWFPDLYFQADNVPSSGHAGLVKTIVGLGFIRNEHWPQALIDAAKRMHFDFMPGRVPALDSTAGVEAEWDRLRRATFAVIRAAAQNNNVEELLSAIGMTTHQVQDFYAHTNWVEPSNPPAGNGPGWQARGQGSVPTWFDVPKTERDKVVVTGDSAPGQRGHGSWQEDGNKNLKSATGKDWPGRPLNAEAQMAAYFATRQWVRALRTWVADDAFWARAQRYASNLSALNHDISGAFNISWQAGRWAGEGGVCTPFCGEDSGAGGSLLGLDLSVKAYFLTRGRTIFRRTFERVVRQISADNPPAVPLSAVPVQSSAELQAQTQFVRARVLRMRGVGFGGLGDPGPDDAALYARATIAGQHYTSAVINGHDSFSFPRPYYPLTFIKAIPVGARFNEPVSQILIQVRTGSRRFAGTDDDVSLRLGPGLSFNLDKRLYDDFERGDRDTYSAPIDAVTRAGFSIGDIRFVEIHKSRDGIAGGWRLGGIKVIVNGRTLYSNDNIERWLEDDHRTFRAPNITTDHRTGLALPFWLDLREDDIVYGGDDQGDINEFDGRDAVARGYVPDTIVEANADGGDRLGGRLGKGGDDAALRYRLDTLHPILPPPPVFEPPPPPPPPVIQPPPPPPPPVKPDLVILSVFINEFTIRNQGGSAAGPFSVTVTQQGQPNQTIQFPAGLAAGAQETRTFSGTCEGPLATAIADSGSAVDESNETNNQLTAPPRVC